MTPDGALESDEAVCWFEYHTSHRGATVVVSFLGCRVIYGAELIRRSRLELGAGIQAGPIEVGLFSCPADQESLESAITSLTLGLGVLLLTTSAAGTNISCLFGIVISRVHRRCLQNQGPVECLYRPGKSVELRGEDTIVGVLSVDDAGGGPPDGLGGPGAVWDVAN